MLVRDILLEKKVSPGERKAILLKIDAYEKKMRELQQYRDNAFAMSATAHPPGMMEKIAQTVEAYKQEINRLEAQLYDDHRNDSDDEGNNKRLVKLLAGISKNCSEALTIYKSSQKFLYRGSNDDAEAIFGKPYEDRLAKDSNQELADALNYAMEKKGVLARRDNSIFTGAKTHATGYGRNVYMIFPVNGFGFSWSTTHPDLVLRPLHAIRMLDEKKVHYLWNIFINDIKMVHEFAKKTRIDDFSKEHIMNVMGEGFLGRDNFEKQISALEEFAMDIKLGDLSGPIASRGLKALVDPDRAMQYFGIRTDDLEAALNSNTEILINGAYYGIREDLERQVRKILGMKAIATWY